MNEIGTLIISSVAGAIFGMTGAARPIYDTLDKIDPNTRNKFFDRVCNDIEGDNQFPVAAFLRGIQFDYVLGDMLHYLPKSDD